MHFPLLSGLPGWLPLGFFSDFVYKFFNLRSLNCRQWILYSLTLPTTTSVSSSASSSSPPTLPSPATLLFFLWLGGQRVDSLCLHLSHISCAVLELGTCCDRSAFINSLAAQHTFSSIFHVQFPVLYNGTCCCFYCCCLGKLPFVRMWILLYLYLRDFLDPLHTASDKAERNAEHELAMNLAKGNKLKNKRPKITEKSIENKLLWVVPQK